MTTQNKSYKSFRLLMRIIRWWNKLFRRKDPIEPEVAHIKSMSDSMGGEGKMAKYDPLKYYLQGSPEGTNDVTLSFENIEKIIGDILPPAAYKHRAWWANEKNGVHVAAHAWMDAGWKVDTVNQREQWVRFVRQKPITATKPIRVIPTKREVSTIEDRRPTMFSANNPNKTLVIHKPTCIKIPWEKLDDCGCGDRGERGNQRWFCEHHISKQRVDKFMDHRFWAILLCDICFGSDID